MRRAWISAIGIFISVSAIWGQTPSHGALLLTNNAAFVVLPGGDITIATSAGIKQEGQSAIVLYGDLENHGKIVPGDGYLLCTGPSTQVLRGTQEITLNHWWFRKSAPSDVVKIDNDVRVYQPLTVNTVTLEIIHSSSHTVTLDSDLKINADGKWIVASTGTTGRDHQIVLRGNAQIDGQWILRPILNNDNYRARLRFQTTATQTLTGSGTVQFYQVILDKGSKANRVESWMNVGLSALGSGSAMDFIAGTWQQTTGTLTFDNGVSTSYNETIAANGSLQILGDASMIIGQNGAGSSLILDGGEFIVNTTGFVNIGSQNDNSLQYTDAGGSRFELHQGTVTVAGRFSRQTATGTNTVDYLQTGGTLIVGAVGHSNGSLGTFDIGASGSSFTMSGGTIILRNANSSGSSSRPADFNVQAATVAVSGGTVQFGDAGTTTPQRFDYDVPNGALWHVSVSSANATVYPFSPTSDLRIQGNFYNAGRWDGTQTRSGTAVSTAGIVFEGSGATSQTVRSPGTTTFATLRMNRGAGSGIVQLLDDISVSHQVDLREGSNSQPQILALGSGANLYVLSTSTTAIIDYASAPIRYIRTSTTSGRVVWNVTAGKTYFFPIGSAESGDTYTPAEVAIGSGGSDGRIGIRVSRGQRADGAHLQLPSSATDFLRRYWSISNVTMTHPAQWTFYYQDGAAHLAGSEANLAQAGRWRPINEAPGGNWVGYAATVNPSQNFFQLPTLDASLLEGDWTLANEIFRQIFYSRQSGPWSQHTSWTYSPTHVGPSVATGVYPAAATDSVVIGGGSYGVGNHHIQLDLSVTIGGVTVGTSATNTGTLELRDNIISGDWFVLQDQSTLMIGSTSGIMAVPAAAGNVQTTYRVFATTATYVYNGTTSQTIGTALPSTVATFRVDNTGPAGNNRVTVDRTIQVTRDLEILQGELDVTTVTMPNVSASGNFVLATDASVRIGGSNNFGAAFAGYTTYTLATNSTVEFYGNSKTVDMPPNGGLGYGYLVISDAPTKYINAPLRVRRDVTINPGAFLWNNVSGNQFQVLGNIVNHGQLCNDGIIEIGIP